MKNVCFLRLVKDKKIGIWLSKNCFFFLYCVTEWGLGYFFLLAHLAHTMCSLGLSKLKDGALSYSLMMCHTANKAFLLKRVS